MIPVVFVHGIWKDGLSFRKMSEHLQKQGLKTFAIDLVPNNGSVPLEVLAEQLSVFVEKIGSPIDLIGFSMGGLVSRYYIQRLDGNKYVRRFITIGSPHHGTWTASLSRLPASQQMRVNSSWLKSLNEDVYSLSKHNVVSIWTPFDLMIIPRESAKLPVGHDVRITVPTHHMLLSDRRVLNVVKGELF